MAATISATDTELPKAVNNVMMARFLKRALASAPYFAGTQAASIGMHRNSLTGKWRRYENITPSTTALTEQTTTASAFARDSVAVSVTDVTAVVAKYGQYIILSEEADLVNPTGQDAELMDVIGIAAGRSANMLQRDEMEDNSGLSLMGGVASDGLVTAKISAAALDTVINSLMRQDALPFTGITTGSQNIGTNPVMDAFWGINHPDVAYDVTTLTGFKSVETYAGQVRTMPGEYGFYGRAGKGIRFLSTSDASIDAGSGAVTSGTTLRGSTNIDLYTTVIYGMNAAGSLGFNVDHPEEVFRAGDSLRSVDVIAHARGSAGSADALDEISTLGYKFWHAAKVLNTNWIQGIRSGATSLSA